ncbi:MAG: LCP family protein [Candidatus Moranbacteria bacterium]|nr:LCP family protein [Candidatus Moranbacteria bacterium]
MRKILVFPISLFLFMAFLVFPARAESIVPDSVEHVDSYAVEMDVSSDSSVAVTETIQYDYADKTETGFTRNIPLAYQDLDGTNFSIGISNVSVSNENGKPYVFSQSKVAGADKKKSYLKIEIGDINYPVSGTPTYVIRYTVSGAIKYATDHDQLFWNITGDQWPVYVKYPEVKISLPQKVDSEKIAKDCFIGIPAATIKCIDRLNSKKKTVAYYSYKGVVAGEGMTTVIGFPKGLVQKPAIQKVYWTALTTNRWIWVLFLLAVLLILIIAVFSIIYFKKIAGFFSRRKWSKIRLFISEKIKKYYAKHIRDKSRKWQITAGIVLTVILISGGTIFWKVGNTLNKILVKGESIGSVVNAALDNQGQLKGESDDRINILLLGILGANHPGGGLNTDTIMVISLKPKANKLFLVSIPRDLWVTDPGKDTKSKLNAVYAYGEEKGSGQGITDMENMVGDITGLPIHYAAVVSTEGFAQLVDTLGGVEADLSEPFDESAQFTDIEVCDSDTYTIPTGKFQRKKDNGKTVAKYPLCQNSNPECGGNFHLPAGKNILNGEQALCFVRSRYSTNDFERAKRQQLILQQLKQKLTRLDFNDFGKINPILNNLGDNVRTDMQLWEMRRLFDLYKGMDNPKIYQRVLEDSKEGLLYSPDKTPETGSILLPRGDDYDKIKNLFQNIFNAENQSDIQPKI